MPTKNRAKPKVASEPVQLIDEAVDAQPSLSSNELPQPQIFVDEAPVDAATEEVPLTLNCVNLVGHCGSDPDIRYFESGTVKATVSLAVRRRSKDSPPNWFNLEMWASTAEVLANYVRKGDQIGVTGYLKIETWTDRELGISRSKPVIKVERLYLLSSKRSSENFNEEEEA